MNIAWVYFDIGHFNEGAPFLKYINSYQKTNGDKASVIVINMLNGMFYSYKNDYKTADTYFKTAIESGKKVMNNPTCPMRI